MDIPQLQLIDNHDVTMAKSLSHSLGNTKSLKVATAFISRSGLDALQESLSGLLERGADTEIIFGLDMRISEPAAIRKLTGYSKEFSNLRFYAFSDFRQNDVPTFHPKLYILEKTSEFVIFVGSSNLTMGGLQNNVELNVSMQLPPAHPMVEGCTAAYFRYRNQESQFVPDEEYTELYDEAYRAMRRSSQRTIKRPATRELIKKLKQRESQLEGTVPTQKGLVIQAIKSIRASEDDYVHLKDIYQWVTQEARVRNLNFDWHTLNNSIRGRINDNVVGKGSGEELFVREGGIYGRKGKYRLSEKGEQYAGR